MNDLETEEPLSITSDSSFIVLGQGSLPSSTENEGTEEKEKTFFVFESDNSLGIRNGPGKSDGWSYLEENIEEKIKQLVTENNQLKETLVQNNLAIRSQLDTFYMWQQEVLKTHKSHKEKFLETKDLILKLRAENVDLRKQLAEGSWTVGDDDDVVPKAGGKCDCDNLKEEVVKLKSMCEDLTSKNDILEMENTKLRGKLEVTEKEVLRLNSEMKDLREKQNLICESLSNSETQTQMRNLEEVGVEGVEKPELKCLEADNCSDHKLSMLEKLSNYLKELEDMKIFYEGQTKGFSTLQNWVAIAEENVDSSNENLSGEIKGLKSHINQEEKTCKQNQENLQELRDQFVRLLGDYKVLQEQLTLLQSKNSDAEKDKNENVSLSQQLESKEEELLLKQQECDELKEEIKKLNMKCEEDSVLKILLELYQSDFNEERAAREKLVGEKEEMAEQIRHLQSRLEVFEKEHGEEKHNETAQKTQSFFRPHETGKGRFVCPKCMFSFRDLKNCEEHVEECLNVHFYP